MEPEPREASTAAPALVPAMHDGSLWFRFTLCVLATWRVSCLVAHEYGPST